MHDFAYSGTMIGVCIHSVQVLETGDHSQPEWTK